MKKIQTIYKPKGSAGQYSPFGLNPYTGCDHGCFYCYQQCIVNRFQPDVDFTSIKSRPGFIESLLLDAPKFSGGEQVTLCFGCDPYNHINDQLQLTRQSLKILLANKICAAILTKGGMKATADTDIILQFGKHIMVGTTPTFVRNADSRKYEPGAALPMERLAMVKHFHDIGVTTWTSFEPVIDPAQSLDLMEMYAPYTNCFKIGKLNHNPKLEKSIDWRKFLDDAVAIMRKHNKTFIIKSDLLKFNNGTFLYSWETDPRSLDVPPFKL